MMKLKVDLNEEYLLEAIPFIWNRRLSPSGLDWGCIKKVQGKLMCFDSEMMGELKDAIILSSSYFTLPQLMNLKKRGCIAVIIPHQITYDVFDTGSFPHVFYLKEDQFEKLKSYKDLEVEINVDLKSFKEVSDDFYDIIYYDEDVSYDLIRKILFDGYSYLQKFFHKYNMRDVPRFTVYFFKGKEHQKQYAFLETSYAYKNYFMVLQYEECYSSSESVSRSYSEIHEMTHLFLYNATNSVFLLEEGIPTYLSVKAGNYIDKKLWYSLAAKNKFESYTGEMEKFLMADKERITEHIHYEMAASFIAWLDEMFDMQKILSCYNIINKKNQLLTNLILFKEVFGIELHEAEFLWRQHLHLYKYALDCTKYCVGGMTD